MVGERDHHPRGRVTPSPRVRLAAPVVLAIAAVLHGLIEVGSAGAARWQDVMAGEPDSVVFLMTDGALVKAPFHLERQVTLWTPRRQERVSRLLAAPDGGRIAWLSRTGDRGPTALWVGGREAAHPVMTFPGLVPADYGSVYFESAAPTSADPVVRGARLMTPNPIGRGLSSNALEWTIDGRTVLCGSGRGLIQSPADTGAARLLSEDRVIALRRLSPSPIYLAHMIQLDAGSRIRNAPPSDPRPTPEGSMTGTWPRSVRIPEGERADGSPVLAEKTSIERRVLLYLAGGRVRAFDSSGLDPSDLWTASYETVWWIHDNAVHAVRAQNPTPTVEVEASSPITWIEYEPRRHALVWVAGSRMSMHAEEDGRDSLLFDLGAPVRRVITPIRGAMHGLVTDEQLVLWDPADDTRRVVDSGGVRATGMFATSDGKVFVVASGGALRGAPLELYRADVENRRLERIATPALKGARLAATPSGARLVLYRPGSRPPESLQVFDPALGTWTEVDNPGIAGWEPLGESSP